jgi:para-nitrobenzyl esterase
MIHAMRRIVLLVSLCLVPAFAADSIHVEQGLISGIPGGSPGVRVYKGIPFAAPPVGDLRWAAPKPPAPWQGVRDGSKFGNACPQSPYPKSSVYFRDPEPIGEDCLYLNVWTAAKASKEKRPVMVWIYGGSLVRGSGSLPDYNGENFAKKGVVLVTINYRLGILGSLAHPELTAESEHKVSGNYQLLDQIAALAWVKKNIAAFGGDPARVTVFGESAGSLSICYLVASPLAKGLFAHAIAESGACFAPRNAGPGQLARAIPSLADAEKLGARLSPSIRELRAKSVDEILRTPNIGPVEDGWVFPEDVYSIYSHGKQNDVPIIVGSNADEATSLFPPPTTATAAAFIQQTTRQYGESAAEFLKLYPVSDDKSAVDAYYANLRDQNFGWNMRTWARTQEATGKSKAWLYQFSRTPPGPEGARYGAYHAAEIQYVFGVPMPPQPWESTDRELSSQIMTYWVNFATKGDPNGKGVPPWPAYTQKADESMIFGDKISVTSGLKREQLDFFDRYYNHRRTEK